MSERAAKGLGLTAACLGGACELCPGRSNTGVTCQCSCHVRKGLAEVLAEHGADVTSYDAGDIHGCDCRWQVPEMPNEVRWSGGDWDAYNAHLEAAVLDWVRERLAGAREDVAEAIGDTADTCQAYTPWEDIADAGLNAVAEALGVGEVRA